MTTFREVLEQRWRELGWSQAEFCRQVNSPAGWVQQIRTGRKSPPLDRLEVWCDVLGLTGEKRLRFALLASAAHVPASHRAPIEGLIAAALPLAPST